MIYQWAVIGAGPAGIAAVGKLLDAGIQGSEILWIDPKFQVGDFGALWSNVPSNTKVKLFLKFLGAVKAFAYENLPNFALKSADPEATCNLQLMAEPLQWVTEQLKAKVTVLEGWVEHLAYSHRTWQITVNNQDPLRASHIILAVGAEPKNLALPCAHLIPLSVAMDKQHLKSQVESNDTIAVFGSSHSAILVLRNLVEHKVKRIINFYRMPLRYALYLEDWILFDDTGLKGPTAEWARQHIDGQWPENLHRLVSNEENIQHYLPQCDKVIYAVGFERRFLPTIEGVDSQDYIKESGVIAPGLFGLGIAFPEAKYNSLGLLEHRVGLWKFMEYLERVLPIWLAYPK